LHFIFLDILIIVVIVRGDNRIALLQAAHVWWLIKFI
jgi:hypothetical protein